MPPHLNSPSISDASDTFTDSFASHDFSDTSTGSFVVTENLSNTPSASVLVLSENIDGSSIEDSICIVSSTCTLDEDIDLNKNYVSQFETNESFIADISSTAFTSQTIKDEEKPIPENSSPVNTTTTNSDASCTQRENPDEVKCNRDNSSVRTFDQGEKEQRHSRILHEFGNKDKVRLELSLSRKHSRIMVTVGCFVMLLCLWMLLPASGRNHCVFGIDKYGSVKYEEPVPVFTNRRSERRERRRQKKHERRNRRKHIGNKYSESESMENLSLLDAKDEKNNGNMDNSGWKESINDKLNGSIKQDLSAIVRASKDVHIALQVLIQSFNQYLSKHIVSLSSVQTETRPVTSSAINNPVHTTEKDMGKNDANHSNDEKYSTSTDTSDIYVPDRKSEDTECTCESRLKNDSRDDFINLDTTEESLKMESEERKHTFRIRLDEYDVSSDENLLRPDSSNLGYVPGLLVEDMWSNDANDVLVALHELVMLLKGTEEETVQTIRIIHKEIGGFPIVVGALRKWYKNQRIQEVGLEFLRLALQSDWSVFQQSARSTDAVHVVLTAMNNFPNNENIQQGGCGSLNSLTRTTGDYSKKLVTTELEIIDVTLEAIKAFPMNSLIRRYVCKTLYKMSRWDVLRKPIQKKGGIKILKKALKMNYNDDETKNFAMYTLRRLDK